MFSLDASLTISTTVLTLLCIGYCMGLNVLYTQMQKQMTN